MMKIKLLLMMICLQLAGLRNVAHAQNCKPMVDDLMAFAKVNGHIIGIEMVMITSPLKWSQYTTGSLSYVAATQVGKLPFPNALGGNATQYFSDRTWQSPGGNGFLPGNPFDPQKTDKVHIRIGPTIFSSAPQVAFTLLSQGNAKSTSTPACGNGFMSGVVPGGMYVFSFEKIALPPSPK